MIEIGDLLNAVQHLFGKAQNLQLLQIRFLTAVVGNILLTLGVQRGKILVAEGNAAFCGYLAHHGVKGDSVGGVFLGKLAQGHLVGNLCGKVRDTSHVGGKVCTNGVQPVEVFLGGDGITVDVHDRGIGTDAGCLIEDAVGADAGFVIIKNSGAGHQRGNSQHGNKSLQHDHMVLS